MNDSSIIMNDSSIKSTSPKANTPRILWIDAAKAFALFCIIIAHTDLWPIVANIDLLRLPIFWIAAGYTSRPSFKIHTKAIKIIKPYLIMNALCLCFTFIVQKGSITAISILGIFIPGYIFSRLNPTPIRLF